MKRFTQVDRTGSHVLVVAASALVAVMAGSTGAFAQAAPIVTAQPGCTSTFPNNPVANGERQIIGGVTGVANSINTVIGTINTSFLAQGNAFVAGLPNPTPDETSGGIWGRVIGGRVDEKSTGTFNGSIGASAAFGTPAASGTVTCGSDVRLNYGGFQMGQDIARLNIGGNGGTVHVGVTAGYAEANAQDRGGSNFTGNFQVPFAGVYAAYTQGKFFADVLVRGDLYQMNLYSPDAALSNQRLNAVGGTVSGSAGYRFDLGHDWFFEPSASGIYSKVRIDTLNTPEGFGNATNLLALSPASIAFNDYVSVLGRIGARVGTTLNGGSIIWQPFATASVWHEFEGASTGAYKSPAYPFGFFGGTDFSTSGSLSNSRVGTYGQYSIGTAAQVIGSPVLAYMRIDYKNGSNIEALGFNAGLRYNFDPAVKVIPGVFKAPPRTVVAAYDWTGFYVGGFTGATGGHSNWFFPPIASGINSRTAGVLGGIDAGYRKQFGSWVVGVEGDVAATNAKGGHSCISSLINFGFPVETNCNNDVRYMATATGKLGYAWNSVLVYGKAGGAWTNNGLDVSCNGDPGFQFNCTAANSLFNPGIAHAVATVHPFGWTAGIGFELGLTPNWSAKAEYDYLGFGSQNVILTDTTSVRLRQDFNQVKIGLNYRFGPSGDVEVAPTMPLKAKAAPAVAFNWTGGYIGAAAADRWSDASWNTTAIGNGFGAIPPLFAPDPTTTPVSFFSSAMQGRLYGGYNWQFSPKWVAGFEGDVGFGDSRMTRGGIPGTFGNGANNVLAGFPGIEAEQHDSSSLKLGWDASIRGRVGMLIAPSVLFYGTGGVAFQQVSTSASCDAFSIFGPGTGPGSWCGFSGIAKSQTFSTTRTGWTAGGGVEAVITGNWLGKVEVRYADYGRFARTFFAGTGDDVVSSFHLNTYTALAGVSYKFGPSVVVAKY
jgi:opacity protein-like surface antigen